MNFLTKCPMLALLTWRMCNIFGQLSWSALTPADPSLGWAWPMICGFILTRQKD